jgi:hypothetical protein
MSRSIDWTKTYKSPVGDIRRGNGNQNTAGSMKEAFAKGQVAMQEQEKANATLMKALPIMNNILLQRMVSGSPIKIVRPLPYTTERIAGQEPEEEDDGFYAIKKSGNFNAKFESITKVIPPGTQMVFMTLEKSLNQLWFKTDKGEEVGIYLDERNRILVNSDICDLVQGYLAQEEE